VTGQIERPFNALAVFFRGATVAELADAGAKRISVGSALAWAALDPVIRAGKEMLEQGTFEWTKRTAGSTDVRKYLADPPPR
jgi:2-methylisocitrate lyase-like PEP mutase family enzyme